MIGFPALFHTELNAVRRTWLGRVMLGVFLALAVMSILIGRFGPEFTEAVMGDAYAGIVPAASWAETYAQWTKNLAQLAMIAVIVSAGGSTASLVSSGRARLLAVRPADRSAQPIAAFAARAVVLVVGCMCGVALLYSLTRLAFADAPLRQLLLASAAWVVTALVFLALTCGLSAAVSSPGAATGCALGCYVLCAALSGFAPLAKYTPLGLIGAPNTLVGGGTAALAVPALTGLLVACCALTIGAHAFARREL
ncbi:MULTISPECIES: hypothetical protein [unclassified Actinobaculum]|uniref:hypothetical protein n=1 Tax=unclassified Actinobaculum TaxID=2609299 RepID=UPI000D5273A0|nr:MULTISPECIES: hypothetical protein [unclassified Actinobaculum]AWE41915.1 hypothetical protein DDD63_03135 [Actinobaculum sp. 313]RTE50171.1 hypothetical protein EKN07_02830 [Actinobaculum sp. 352]